MKISFITILSVLIFMMLVTHVKAFEQTGRVIIFATPTMSINCNNFEKDTIGQTYTPYSCIFEFSVIWSEESIKLCSLDTYDSVTNKTLVNAKLEDIISSKTNVTQFKEDNFFEYNISYPIKLYFTEEGHHRIIFDLNCDFWKDQANPTIKTLDIDTMSPTAFLQYRMVKYQLDEQKKFNENSYTVAIISLIIALVSVIVTAISVIRKDNKRVVEISKIHDKIQFEKVKERET